MYRAISVVLALLVGYVHAHEFTPTYPKMRPSYVPGVYVTTMKLFNKRQDVSYYKVGVFDNNWNAISFAASSDIVQLNYLSSTNIDVYIRKEDLNKATYICTKSMISLDNKASTAIASRICSKIK